MLHKEIKSVNSTEFHVGKSTYQYLEMHIPALKTIQSLCSTICAGNQLTRIIDQLTGNDRWNV